MPNERKTESIVRKILKQNGFYKASISLHVEEQTSDIEMVRKCLKRAGKSGYGGKGSPEFIVSDQEITDFLMVIECKASTKDHESKELNNPARYAVDGALHYAKHLASEYNVIAVGISGETESSIKTTIHLHVKGEDGPRILTNLEGKPLRALIPWGDLMRLCVQLNDVQKVREKDLISFSRNIHDFMRDHAKLTEQEKPLLVSGTLIALQNAAFSASFDKYKAVELSKRWFQVIQEELEKANLPHSKKQQVSQPYSNLSVLPALSKPNSKWPKGVLYELVRELNEKVWPFVKIYQEYDVVGQFYGEFLKYTGGDKKGLGIVLTPRHITDLFARLANLSVDSTVLDPCAGTGGFLISAMHRMVEQASTQKEINRIKSKGLVGIEEQPNMFALAASNMILRGDGKANLYQGSCFDSNLISEVKKHHCDVALLNPPFSQKDEDLHELQFVKQALDCLATGGTGVAIVPMSCAISPHPIKEELMRYHTLEAVMSMPDDLFYPVGTVTCVMVWTAHKPHEHSNRKTWFGYWKDDGHLKIKHRGRVDVDNRWREISKSWVESFRNREVHEGLSVLQKVNAQDEWCAEAYMETDYSKLDQRLFVEALQKYQAYEVTRPRENSDFIYPDEKGWQYFPLDSLFDLKKGKRITKLATKPGKTPFVSSIDSNNGISRYISEKPIHQGNTVTVNYDGSVAEAYYQPDPFWALDSVNVLYPKFEMKPKVGIFIAAIIRNEKYRFNYGRKWHLERMRNSKIKLPAKPNGQLDVDWIEQYMSKLL